MTLETQLYKRIWEKNHCGRYIHPETWICFVVIFHLFSGLSLVLNKDGLWLTRQTLSLSELKGEWKPSRLDTSCRSESSDTNLVTVLDKDTNMRGATRNKFIVLVLSRPLILTIINCVWKKIKFGHQHWKMCSKHFHSP